MIKIEKVDFVKHQFERYLIQRANLPMTYKSVFMNLKSDMNFRSQVIALLSKSSFSSFRFETPSVTKESEDQGFEFVLVNSPDLSDEQDDGPFLEPMQKSNDSVI